MEADRAAAEERAAALAAERQSFDDARAQQQADDEQVTQWRFMVQPLESDRAWRRRVIPTALEIFALFLRA